MKKGLSLILSVIFFTMAGHAQHVLSPGWYSSMSLLKEAESGGTTNSGLTSSKTMATPGFLPPLVMLGSSNIAEAVTPEIQSLALGLQNDQTRIFDYVHDHIRHVLYFGSKKGAQLTLEERSGNDFDQCALLVALLQAAGYTNVGYQFGMLKIPYDNANHLDLHHWLCLNLVNTNWSNTTAYLQQLLNLRGYATSQAYIDEGDNNTVAFQRIWVTNSVGGTNYFLDPAFKDSEPVAGINLLSAMGYASSTALSNALMSAAGGTDSVNYVQNLNEGAVRTNLVAANSNLLATIQSSYPNASVQQILGGEQIMPWTNALSQSTLFPIETGGGTYPVLGWPYQPTNFMSTLSISFGVITQTWFFPQLEGQRLSLTFGANALAQLWLDDALIVQTNVASFGTSLSVGITADHPYGEWDTNNNIPVDTGVQDVTMYNNYLTTNASYAIIYGFEPDQKRLLEREQQLDSYIARGYTNTSRQVTTETLNVMGLNWLLQTKLNHDILGQQMGILDQFHERIGRMGQEQNRGYYVDMYMQVSGSYDNNVYDPSDLSGLGNNSLRYIGVTSYIDSAMEHGLIEQQQASGLVAASTVKFLELANTNHVPIYLANLGNYNTGANVRSLLAGTYSASALSQVDNAVYSGGNVLVPTNGSIQVNGAGSYKGDGFVELNMTSGFQMGMIIGGGYNGGFVSSPTAIPSSYTVQSYFTAQSGYYEPFTTVLPASLNLNADPVNMTDASFRLSTTDLSIAAPEPMGISFSRYYSPTRRFANAAFLGNGWVDSYYFNLQMISDPEPSLGSTTPAQMTPMLTTTCAVISLYNQAQMDPKNWMVNALIAKWGIDQMTSNAVSVALGDDTLEFIRQPGGALIPPAGRALSLTNSGTYKLQQRHGNAFLFNSSLRLTSITNQSGDTLSLSYTGTNLTTVTDWKSRTLTLTYSGSPYRITGITDFSNRAVSFGYTTNTDKNLDLASVTDPNGNISRYSYDTNHQMTATYDALGRMVVTNFYDGFGHVITQYTQGLTNKTWQIFWSDWESVVQDPAGNEQYYFYDDQHRQVGHRDALGNFNQTVYDGQDHVVTNISPLNEISTSVYDGNNNVIGTVDPTGATNQFLYDTNNNLVQAIDARGNITSYGYDSAFRLTGTTNAAGNWINYAYNSDGTLATNTTPGGMTTYSYDSHGTLSKITYPGGLGSEGFLNSALGDILNHTNARGFVTSFQYNSRRQPTNSVGPTNLTTRIAYDAVGNAISAADARGNIITNVWSVTQQPLATILPTVMAGTAVTTNIYDNRDWLAQAIDPLGHASNFTNDPSHRLVAATDPLMRTTTLGYDADGHNITATNAAGNASSKQFDMRGANTATTDGAGRVAQYAFDGVGNQVLLTNRNGKVWQFQFDAANRLTNSISPLNRAAGLLFNNRGLLISSVDPAGRTTTLNYDPKGRLTNRVDLVGTSVFSYDADDNRTNVTEGSKSNSWAYDAYDQLVSYKDTAGNVLQYKYDANGNLTNLIYPNGKTVTYGYDARNELTNVADWSGRRTVMAYDLAGRMTSITRPNGTQRIFGYDAAGQTTNITEKSSSGGIIAFYKLGWDQAARMATEYGAPLPHAAAVPTRTMTFDDDDRMTGIDGNTLANDADGNMTSGPLTNDTLVSYTYDARNRLVNVGGVTNTYDALNNRIGQAYGTNQLLFCIDPSSKLSKMLVRIKNSVTNYYVYGPGLLYQVTESAAFTNVVTYHYDYRGSTVAMTDSSGTNITDRFEYSAYGMTTYRSGTNDTQFLYNGLSGVMTDPNGLLYMRARYYNPYLCRFLNPDPSGFSGGLDIYMFCNDNPINAEDPFGLAEITVSSGIGGVVGMPIRFKDGDVPGPSGFLSGQLTTGIIFDTQDFLNSKITFDGQLVGMGGWGVALMGGEANQVGLNLGAPTKSGWNFANTLHVEAGASGFEEIPVGGSLQADVPLTANPFSLSGWAQIKPGDKVTGGWGAYAAAGFPLNAEYVTPSFRDMGQAVDNGVEKVGSWISSFFSTAHKTK